MESYVAFTQSPCPGYDMVKVQDPSGRSLEGALWQMYGLIRRRQPPTSFNTHAANLGLIQDEAQPMRKSYDTNSINTI